MKHLFVHLHIIIVIIIEFERSFKERFYSTRTTRTSGATGEIK